MDGDKPKPKPRSQNQESQKTNELANIAEDDSEDHKVKYEDEYSDTSSIRSGDSDLSEPDEALNKEQRSIKVRNIYDFLHFLWLKHFILH